MGEVVTVRGLIDSGCTRSIILKNFVEKKRLKRAGRLRNPIEYQTYGGVFRARKQARVDFLLPNISTTRKVEWEFTVDESSDPATAPYDMIIGTDLLTALEMDLKFSNQTIVWDDLTAPMQTSKDQDEDEIAYVLATEAPILKQAEERQNRILDANYTAIDLDEKVNAMSELSAHQKEQLIKTLKKFPELFSGGLGTIDIEPIHLEIEEGARPKHSKPYPVPKAYEKVTKKECTRFCDIGVLEEANHSQWAAPSFVQPKKTGDVRVLTDFRELNKVLIRKPYPLPKIQDLLQKMEKFKYATALDLSMGYYHIPLYEYSQNLCITILPWGKSKYKNYQWESLQPLIFFRKL